MFNPALVPDFLKGRQVARLWIRDLIHGFSLYDSSGPLLITIPEIVTLSFMLECLGADADIKPAHVKSQEFKEHEKCLSGESSSFSPHDQASGVIPAVQYFLYAQINNGIIHSFPLSEYINAKEWRHLLRALWRTDQTTAELIHLQDEVRIKVDAVMIPGNLRSIKFETLDKLPSLLAFTPPRASRRTPAPFPTEWMPPKELLPPTTQTSVDSQVSGGIAEAAPVNGESPREVSAGQQQSVADEGQLDLALMDVQTSVSAQSKEEAMEDKIVAVIESAAAGQQNVAIEG
ncbi:hypothetical protein A0H81_00138 [Grifola frondosa]|uniref:Uncharacterized protein n=1 Tax=Grifola frondosa TaxID=5627 RepID=A0A1C7MQG5_GRIFR|nr:hypothetical protein A0H81_00138 [Grifola frondosa]